MFLRLAYISPQLVATTAWRPDASSPTSLDSTGPAAGPWASTLDSPLQGVSQLRRNVPVLMEHAQHVQMFRVLDV
jgi:hypothetical protein